MRQIILLGMVLAALFCRGASAATTAIVSSCPPGKEPTKQTLVGMLTVHVICDRVIFEIPSRAFNRDILVNTEFAALSTGSDYVAPGSLVDNRVVRLIKLGNKIFLEDVRYEILAREQPNLQRGVEAASLRTVIRVFDIIGEGPGGEPQIDLTSIFTSEVPAGFALDLMRHFHMRAVDPRRSYVQTVKAFPGSIDVRFYQTWMADPTELRKATDDEERPATLGFIFHASILALPQTPMRGSVGSGEADRVLSEPGSSRPMAPVHQARHRGLAEGVRERGVPQRHHCARCAHPTGGPELGPGGRAL